MLAFIGGTGLTRMDDLEIRRRHDIETRYGKPSAPVAEGELNGVPAVSSTHPTLPSNREG